MPAIITENDESKWQDQTGAIYHFPKRYRGLLQSGQEVVYYKGKLIKRGYEVHRLSPHPHYFGTARIGRVYRDPASRKRDLFAEILDFAAFSKPVQIRDPSGAYYESIPENRQTNFWRDGAREVSAERY